MTDLGTLGGDSSDALAINRQQQIVGLSDIASGEVHAFLWQRGVMTDLGTLGGSFSHANAINDHGQIVGNSDTSGDIFFHAVRWTVGRGY
jgi:probable HAF family extracellular repeat protein